AKSRTNICSFCSSTHLREIMKALSPPIHRGSATAQKFLLHVAQSCRHLCSCRSPQRSSNPRSWKVERSLALEKLNVLVNRGKQGFRLRSSANASSSGFTTRPKRVPGLLLVTLV